MPEIVTQSPKTREIRIGRCVPSITLVFKPHNADIRGAIGKVSNRPLDLYLIENAGHYVPLDRPEAVAQAFEADSS